MGRKGRVIRFHRGARRHFKPSAGKTPNSQVRRFGLRRVGTRKGALFAVLGLIFLLPLADAVNGMIKSSPGCRVIAIVDGDTVKLYCPASGFLRARILAYDTPEKAAKCSSEFIKAVAATQYLRWILWTGSTIDARTEGKDRYGRALTVLIVDGEGVARRMVKAGLARWYDGGQRPTWCQKNGSNADV